MKELDYGVYSSFVEQGLKYTNAVVEGTLVMAGGYAVVALYMKGDLRTVEVGGVPAASVVSLNDLSLTQTHAYYYNSTTGLLYIKAFSNSFTVVLQVVNVTEPLVYKPQWPSYTPEPPVSVTVPRVPITLPVWLEPHKDKLAVSMVGLVLLLAPEALAPAFALAAAVLLAVFWASGWLSLPGMAVGLALVGAGLGLAVARKRP